MVQILSGQYQGRKGKIIAISKTGVVDISLDAVALGIRNEIAVPIQKKIWVTEHEINLKKIN